MSDYETPPSLEITSDDKLWAMLSYIFTPLVPVIILLMEDKKNRPFLKAHYFQALVLGIVMVIVGTILSFIPVINCIIPFVWLIIVIIYAVKANKGEYINIPVITDFVKKQGWA